MLLRRTRPDRVDKHSRTCMCVLHHKYMYKLASHESVLILTDFTMCACPSGPTVALVAVTEVFAGADFTGVVFAVTDYRQQTHNMHVDVIAHVKLPRKAESICV